MHRLCDNKLTVATAESCTGGMLAALLTDIEGAGHGFDRGFVPNTKESKRGLRGTGPTLHNQKEPVSEAAARARAEGAQKRPKAAPALGAPGSAGPAGPHHE